MGWMIWAGASQPIEKERGFHTPARPVAAFPRGIFIGQMKSADEISGIPRIRHLFRRAKAGDHPLTDLITRLPVGREFRFTTFP